MAVNNKLVKYFQNFRGLDLRVSDLLREEGAATETKNVALKESGALSKRKGFHRTTTPTGGYGLFSFPNVDVSTDIVTNELLNVDANLNLLSSDSFAITYAGSDSASYFLYLHTDSNFYFDIYDNGTRVLNQNLGVGTEVSFASVSTLTTAINALTDFSCTTATDGSVPSALLSLADDVTIATTGTTLTFDSWNTVATVNGVTNPLSTHYAARNGADFENASFAVVNDVCYIATGEDALLKYDGNRVYKAGIPKGVTPTDGTGAGSALTAGVYLWKYTYSYKDAKENSVESTPTSTTTFTSSGSDSRVITVSNLQNTTGYNTDQCTINGNQNGVNAINVTSNNCKVGDYVWINDGVSGEVVSRKVTASAAALLTIEGDAVNVATTEIISNIKINLYRTKSDGTLYYTVYDLINDTGNATQAQDDVIADASVGLQFIEHTKLHSVPPVGKYIDVWRSDLVISGIKNKVNTVFFSDTDSPEYFPDPDNSFIVDTTVGTKITGLRSLDNALYVFKERSISAVVGDFLNFKFVVDTVSNEGVGCIANHSIQEVAGELWFLSEFGIYSISQKGLTEMSSPISPKFSRLSPYNYKRAQSFLWIDDDRFLMYLPTTNTEGSEVVTTVATSDLFVYDLQWKSWFQWNSMDISGGITYNGSDIYFIDREYAAAHTAVRQYTNKVSNTSTTNDFSDHEAAISFTYKTHWETLGEPAVFKRFLRAKIYSVDVTLNSFESTGGFTLTLTTEHDYDLSSISTIDLDFSAGALGWGNSGWNNFTWGESRVYSLKNKLRSRKTRALRINFTNAVALENVLISGYELDVVAPFHTQMKEN